MWMQECGGFVQQIQTILSQHFKHTEWQQRKKIIIEQIACYLNQLNSIQIPDAKFNFQLHICIKLYTLHVFCAGSN